MFGENLAAGYGVAGRANDGIGVLADSSNGTALQANGMVRFSRSGVATVLAGRRSVQVSLGGLTPGWTFVLATIQANVAKLYVRASGMAGTPTDPDISVRGVSPDVFHTVSASTGDGSVSR